MVVPYKIFNQRPIRQDLIAYCAIDVQHLLELGNMFWVGQTSGWRELVVEESRKRVMASQSPKYQPHGSQKALSPWSQEDNTALNEWSDRLSKYYRDIVTDTSSYRDCINDCDLCYYFN